LTGEQNLHTPTIILTSHIIHFGRVEELAAASSTAVNLIPLRAAIKSLQFASVEFDAEKLVAERVLDRYIRKWRKKHNKRKKGCFKRFIRHLKGFFRMESQEFRVSAPTLANGKVFQPRVGRAPAWLQEQREQKGADGVPHKSDGEVDVQEGAWPHLPLPHKPKHPHYPHWPHRKPHVPHKLIEAAKVVRKINQKLASFERGFIHEEGIKDREWYRHLGVAPGKWLGKT
jgi:N-acetylated-alpha-linked acidic dipeptidase